MNEVQTNPLLGQPEHSPTIDEQEGHCFGCGPRNPQGLQLLFILDNQAHTATAQVILTRLHEGAAGYIHGGIIATLMDEAMSKLNRPFGVLAMTRHLEVDYLRPAPVGKDLILTGRHLRREERKFFHEADLTLPDGTLLAKGKGLFIALDPAVLARRRL